MRFVAVSMSFVYFSVQLTEVKHCLRFCLVTECLSNLCSHALSYRFTSSAWDTNHRLHEKSCLELDYVVQFWCCFVCFWEASAWCMRRLWCCFKHIASCNHNISRNIFNTPANNLYARDGQKWGIIISNINHYWTITNDWRWPGHARYSSKLLIILWHFSITITATTSHTGWYHSCV